MAYTKTIWEDLPSTNTPLNATNLNNIEDQVETNTNDIEDLVSDVATNTGDISSLKTYVENSIDVSSLGDWNSLPYKNGFYKGVSMSNSPSGSTVNPGWWYVIQILHDGSYVRQIAFSFRNDNQAIYSRAKMAGTWGSWEAMMESGSNTNGRYIKYEDGTMICWGQIQRTINVTSGFDGVYYGNITYVSFPATFNIAPTMTINTYIGTGLYCSCINSISVNGWAGYLWSPGSHSNVNATIHYVAIGRWKA